MSERKILSYDPQREAITDVFVELVGNGSVVGTALKVNDASLLTKETFVRGRLKVYAKMNAIDGTKKVSFGFMSPSIGEIVRFQLVGNTFKIVSLGGNGAKDVTLPTTLLSELDSTNVILKYEVSWEPNKLEFFIDGVSKGVVSEHIPRVPMSAFLTASDSGDFSVYQIVVEE